MQMVLPRWAARGLDSPREIPNLVAWYSLDGEASETSNQIRIDGSNRTSLVADRSGNSSTLVWANNDGTVASQSVSAPNKSVTGSFPITIALKMETTRPAADRTVIDKLSGNNGFQVLVLTTGVVRLRVGNGASVTNVDSTVALTSVIQTQVEIGVVWTDGVGASFTQNGSALGTAVAAAVTLTNAAVSCVIGRFLGVFSRVQIGGFYDCNPALATGKFVASFSSGGDTWTVATANASGARICGERDWVQLTLTSQPAYDASNRMITFDGANDWLTAAGVGASSNALTIFAVARRGAAVSGANVFGRIASFAGQTGSDFNSLNGVLISLNRTSNILDWFRNSSSIASVAIPAVGTPFMVAAVLNGSGGSIRRDRGTPATGSTSGTAISAVKFGVGAEIGGFAPDAYLTGSINEMAVYSGALDTATLDRLALYASQKYGIPV